MEYFYGRLISDNKIDWKEIKVGDVVIEGNVVDKESYRVLTQVDGKYWEYFEGGYYKLTSPEYCHWLIKGQKMSDGKLIYINYENI